MTQSTGRKLLKSTATLSKSPTSAKVLEYGVLRDARHGCSFKVQHQFVALI
jgi:hypothetical protein